MIRLDGDIKPEKERPTKKHPELLALARIVTLLRKNPKIRLGQAILTAVDDRKKLFNLSNYQLAKLLEEFYAPEGDYTELDKQCFLDFFKEPEAESPSGVELFDE